MSIDELIQSKIVTDKLIMDFDLVEPYSNGWEEARQLEYWIGRIIDNAEELQISEESLDHIPLLRDLVDLIIKSRDDMFSSDMFYTPDRKPNFTRLNLAMTIGAQMQYDWGDRLPSRKHYTESMRSYLPDESTLSEKLYENIRLIWADPDFWQLHHQSDDIEETIDKINEYLADGYGMHFPFPYVVWQQMVVKPHHRQYYVCWMCMMPRDYFLLGSPYSHQKRISEADRLKKHPYMDILETYLKVPRLDLGGYLAAKSLPEDALKDLRDLGNQLAENARLCLSTDNKIMLQKAKLLKRPKKLQLALEREKMVGLLRGDPSLAEKRSKLAHAHFGISESGEHQKAEEAILLFKHREYFDSKNKYKGWSI
ncbi:hypothetical protein OAL72_02325 [bacterium]|nr:hypothetical protein [bacterium]